MARSSVARHWFAFSKIEEVALFGIDIRNSEGLQPRHWRNRLLKCPKLEKPTCSAISSKETSVSVNSRAAVSTLRFATKACGDTPKVSLNRRLKWERLIPNSDDKRATDRSPRMFLSMNFTRYSDCFPSSRLTVRQDPEADISITGLSLPQTLLLVPQQWRQQVFDDAALSGLDLRRHRHARREVDHTVFDLHSGFVEGDAR